jgi:hypothetical protein
LQGVLPKYAVLPKYLLGFEKYTAQYILIELPHKKIGRRASGRRGTATMLR